MLLLCSFIVCYGKKEKSSVNSAEGEASHVYLRYWTIQQQPHVFLTFYLLDIFLYNILEGYCIFYCVLVPKIQWVSFASG